MIRAIDSVNFNAAKTIKPKKIVRKVIKLDAQAPSGISQNGTSLSDELSNAFENSPFSQGIGGSTWFALVASTFAPLASKILDATSVSS